MKLAGLQKTTLVDFPGTVACTVFTQGCSFRCHFCHNPELVLPDQFGPLISNEEFIDFLMSRLGKLEGVCITGGEPLLNPDIEQFISHIKALGFKVKLDTNGFYPERLASIIESGDIDYIAMDIKAPLDKYPMVTNIETRNTKHEINPKKLKSYNLQPIKRSIDLIMQSEVDYEFRTTIAKPLLDVNDIEKIAKMIKGAKRYVLQNYQKTKQINESMKLKPFSEKELITLVQKLKEDIEAVLVR
ncbi:anaerobic ribonucleoside-triphosphate reductase activating protein [Candidatus Berkelbacteria bacterium RIFOXYA2_FULL_43_10]|uniref:Anaerobic ribonucleoside-triphosphate reductase activating protein n=1 Tax=Candidatus Berkelbacteria bacterium RIFOXYA2_FULL_43_10 TaxID=1797472 RepID=A0A1F5EB03_9BACT|nr:MAG: anaerobic ribonucleoside-triphosphate reductase activating protein [Candidatus Berkelbacteria bacterium RIFOXYA2_FULL_43_10]